MRCLHSSLVRRSFDGAAPWNHPGRFNQSRATSCFQSNPARSFLDATAMVLSQSPIAKYELCDETANGRKLQHSLIALYCLTEFATDHDWNHPIIRHTSFGRTISSKKLNSVSRWLTSGNEVNLHDVVSSRSLNRYLSICMELPFGRFTQDRDWGVCRN